MLSAKEMWKLALGKNYCESMLFPFPETSNLEFKLAS